MGMFNVVKQGIEKGREKIKLAGSTGLAVSLGMTPEEADASLVGLASKIGQNAKDMLGMAKKMEAEGLDAREIWKKTGWEKNKADGQWRTEHTNFDNTKINILPDGKYNLEEVIDDPVLLDAYDDPELFPSFDLYDDSVQGARDAASLKKINVVFDSKIPANEGQFQGRTLTVGTDGSPDDVRSTILHELQHGIQEREGWARGGTAKEFERENYLYNEKYKNLANHVDKRIKEIESKPPMERKIEEYETLQGLKNAKARMDRYLLESYGDSVEPYEMYYNLAGEVEARNVSNRDALQSYKGSEVLRNRNPERTEQIPDETLLSTRPRDSQIVRYGADDLLEESVVRKNMTRRERRANPPSEALRNYSVGQAGKAIGEMGLGVVQGLGEGLDFFNSANIQRSVMGLPQLTPAQDALSPITNIRLLEDNEGRDNARTIGSLFSPI